MLPDGIPGPALFQLPLVKYGPPPSAAPPPIAPMYGVPYTPSPTYFPSLPTFVPAPALRDTLLFPVMAVVSIGFIILLTACAIAGFIWLSRRGKDKN